MTKLVIEGIISHKKEFVALKLAYQIPFLDLAQMYQIKDLTERSAISIKYTGIIVPSCVALNKLKMPPPQLTEFI